MNFLTCEANVNVYIGIIEAVVFLDCSIWQNLEHACSEIFAPKVSTDIAQVRMQGGESGVFCFYFYSRESARENHLSLCAVGGRNVSSRRDEFRADRHSLPCTIMRIGLIPRRTLVLENYIKRSGIGIWLPLSCQHKHTAKKKKHENNTLTRSVMCTSLWGAEQWRARHYTL